MSWYVHQLTPDIVKRYMVAGTLVIEIVLPFLFYSPFREHRIFATISNMVLMIVIAGTGNYNFFNLLTALLLLIVLDDHFIYKYVPKKVLQVMDIKMPLEQLIKDIKN